MPSRSYRRWRTTRYRALDEIAQAHAAIGGSARGRRYVTQQINRAYAVLLASQFQGFCRDLHSECVDHLLAVLAPPPPMLIVIQSELLRGRQLDRGNAQPSSLGADFGRLGVNFWIEMERHDALARTWKNELDLLNEWRNAVVHEDFTSPKLGGIMALRLRTVRKWRNVCRRLARAMDDVMLRHMLRTTGAAPW